MGCVKKFHMLQTNLLIYFSIFPLKAFMKSNEKYDSLVSKVFKMHTFSKIKVFWTILIWSCLIYTISCTPFLLISELVVSHPMAEYVDLSKLIQVLMTSPPRKFLVVITLLVGEQSSFTPVYIFWWAARRRSLVAIYKAPAAFSLIHLTNVTPHTLDVTFPSQHSHC